MSSAKPAPVKSGINPIQYSVVPIHPEAHLFEVTCSVASPDADGQCFALPAWIPGSYMIREFARNIVSIRAESKGKAVALTKLDKHTWQAAPVRAGAALTLTYTVYAWDLSVRCAHLDQSHGFFNGTSLFLRVLGQEHVPQVLDIRKPAGTAYRSWRVATSLPELKAQRYGFGTYIAADYDELVDHPVEMGDFQLASFNACGASHDVVITGSVPNLDIDQLCSDLTLICSAQIRLFEPRSEQAPFNRYVFLTMVVGDGYGGLEHRASTSLLCSRNDLPVLQQSERSATYRAFLGLASHEYFHSWNVKRIKPAAFVPYDLSSENYTSLLWIFEGFTSYYDDLILVRTGLLTETQYLAGLVKTISAVLRTSGRQKQSVAESSFDAWTKYYRQDENSPNAIISYYTKGSLVALALDLYLRAQSSGKKSLDDVMFVLWERFGRDFYSGKAQQGLSEDAFSSIVLDATGISVSEQVSAWAYGTDDLPLADLFDAVEVALELKPEHNRPVLGAKIATANGETRLTQVFDGGPAQAAGLSAGDVLVAIDNLRVTDKLDTILARYRAGDTVSLHAFRRDELRQFNLTLAQDLPVHCTLTAGKKRRAALSLRKHWLGQ